MSGKGSTKKRFLAMMMIIIIQCQGRFFYGNIGLTKMNTITPSIEVLVHCRLWSQCIQRPGSLREGIITAC